VKVHSVVTRTSCEGVLFPGGHAALLANLLVTTGLLAELRAEPLQVAIESQRRRGSTWRDDRAMPAKLAWAHFRSNLPHRDLQVAPVRAF